MLNRIRNLFVKKPKGFSLVETLLFSGIISVVLLGTLRLMGISAQSVKVNKISHVEAELEGLIRKGIMIESDCIYNLDFNKLNGTKLQARGTISSLKWRLHGGTLEPLFSTGQALKDSIEIIKMELTGTINIINPSGPAVERFFTVYYKKLGAGALNTLGAGGRCSSSNVSDCYFKHYKLIYQIAHLGSPPGVPTTIKCAVSVCTQGVCCYTADRIDETLPIDDPVANTNGRSAIGCRGTSNISKSRTVALGFMAGITSTTGYSNIFMGYNAGHHVNTTIPGSSEGSRNTYIGASLGYKGSICPPPDRGYSNIAIGTYAGNCNTGGNKNIFMGFNSGYKSTDSENSVFIGMQAGFDYTGNNNIAIGSALGEISVPFIPKTGGDNIAIGKGAGHMNTSGVSNIFIGHTAGSWNTTGSNNLYIAGRRDHLLQAGITATGDYQFNIGNLILGRMPDPSVFSPPLLQNSPYIISLPGGPTPSEDPFGVVINGDLIVKGKVYSYGKYFSESCCGPLPLKLTSISRGPVLVASSKKYKKNIKPFKNYEKALEDIINTPLFTYEYKKDRPEKSRMGIISEELPKHLQLKEKVDPRLRGDDSSLRGDDSSLRGKAVIPVKTGTQKKISMPDWPSVYGTFWAGIKALFVQFKSFKEKILVELKGIRNILIHLLKVTEGNKNNLISLNTQVEETIQISKNNQIENKQQKKQFMRLRTKLDTTKEDLQTIKQELQKWKHSIKTGTAK